MSQTNTAQNMISVNELLKDLPCTIVPSAITTMRIVYGEEIVDSFKQSSAVGSEIQGDAVCHVKSIRTIAQSWTQLNRFLDESTNDIHVTSFEQAVPLCREPAEINKDKLTGSVLSRASL